MAARLLTPAILLAVLVIAPVPAGSQVQTKDERKCTLALNKGLAKVASARAAGALGCIKQAAKGDSAEACLDAANRRLDAARAKTQKAPCGDVEPPFGVTDPGLVNDAGTTAFPDLLEDVFGGDLDLALATKAEDSAAAKCQSAIAGVLKKCLDARLATFNACKKKGITAGTIDSEEDLEACVGEDPKKKIDRACGFLKKLEKSCKDVSLLEAFPACNISTPNALASCLDEAAECRACAAIHSGDALSGGCPACRPKPVAVVPPASDTAGTVEVTATPGNPFSLPALPNRVGPVIEFGPDGHEFDDLMTVGIPVDASSATPGEPIALFTFNEDEDEWEQLAGSTIQGPLVLAQTDHFSAVAPAEVPIAGCANTYTGSPATIAPMHVPGAIHVTPGVGLRQDIVYSGPNALALGSEWSVPGCVATVTGSFGAVAGNGAWIDYSNGGAISTLAGGQGGQFSLVLTHSTPADPVGPHLGLADPCYAALGVFQYWLTVHFAANCVALCPPGVCNDNNPCTTDTCDPGDGSCSHQPSAVLTCGSGNGGKCIEGKCIMEVVMNTGTTGTLTCMSQGMTCVQPLPVGTPPEEICLAFHPTATVTSSVNGWRQAVWCDTGDQELACQNKTNTCHHCPACNVTGINCGDGVSNLLTSLFVECTP